MDPETSYSTSTLTTHTPDLFRSAVRRAAELLRAGELVALPTETVYGLAANALDPRAVAKIFTVKGRPASNPIIVHVAGVDQARELSEVWPESADRLATAFWPGPLTLVVRKSPQIPDLVTAGGPTVGIRWPTHPIIQAVMRECGFPLPAPSANLSNKVSPTNASHVKQMLDGRIPLIIDGGQAQVGIESTVVDLTTHPPRILRPGMIHTSSLVAVIGTLGTRSESGDQGPLRSPGQLPRHYAPRARLIVLTWRDEAELQAKLNSAGIDPARCQVITHTTIPLGNWLRGVAVIPHDAEAYARALYGELHQADADGCDWIVVEELPDGPEWRGIADRLSRASA